MKTKDIKSMTHTICMKLPGFVVKGVMIVSSPTDGILRGFYFEDSGFDKAAFYVWAFVQPLYIPTTTIGFNLGKRLASGLGERWKVQRPELADELLGVIVKDGLPFIQAAATPAGLAAWTLSLPNTNDPYVIQARAYSLVNAHLNDEALKELALLVCTLDQKVPWMASMTERANRLAQLITNNPERVDACLSEWQIETMSCLKISDLN